MFRFQERLEWRAWVTPHHLREKAIHRWFVFPHSFTSELVYGLIDKWGLGAQDRILDPFVGAGTTVLAAKERGVAAQGYDLSPLAVFAAETKLHNYEAKTLQAGVARLRTDLTRIDAVSPAGGYPSLLEHAFSSRSLTALHAIKGRIRRLPSSEEDKRFFLLALLSILPGFSRAVASGGWLRWRTHTPSYKGIFAAFFDRVDKMIVDIKTGPFPNGTWGAAVADARTLPDAPGQYSAVISSPPYPNRHDYTRVFGVELMFGFCDWEQTRTLRYQSFQSHPESRPMRTKDHTYAVPSRLARSLEVLRTRRCDPRVIQMLDGYFLDTFLCLQEMRRVCRDGARLALVVGNAQYCGESVLVDELVAELGERAGLEIEELVAARYRGNSAQQMGRYGRRQSREAVVVFKKRARVRDASVANFEDYH